MRWAAVLGASCLMSAACHLVAGLGEVDPIDGTGASGGAGGTNSPTTCMSAGDCPDDNPCGTPICDDALCGYELLPAGTVCSEAMDMICNEGGNCVPPVAYPCEDDPSVCPDGFFCADGVCCNSACEGPCERCNLAGLAGICNPLEEGSNPNDACTEGVCDGGGDCAVGDDLWSHMVAATGDQFFLDMATGDDGSVYLAGAFNGVLLVPGGGPTLDAGTLQNGILIKLNSAGDHLWNQAFVFNAGALTGVVVSGDNVYVTGWYDGSMNVNSQMYNANTDEDVFVAQLSSAGTFNWLQTLGSNGQDYSGRIAVDATGATVMAGRNTGGTFTVGPDSYSNQGGSDAFLLKLNEAGDPQWLRWYGGSGDQLIWDVDSTDGGEVAVAGMTSEAFDAGMGMIEHNFGRDIWAARIAATGSTVWARGFGSVADDEGRVARFGDGDRVWIGGYFDTSINFGSTSFVTTDKREAFFVELSAGGTFERGISFGADNDNDELWQAERTVGGGWVLGGSHEGELELSPTISFSDNGGGYDAFVVKLGPNLTPLWAHAIDSFGQSDFIRGLAVDPADNVLLVGEPGSNFSWFGQQQNYVGGLDAFIAKLSP